jgi:poly-gamma-glutamate synthesis protein (capsule biosynthesis protein)
MVNLETAVTTRGTPEPEEFHFQAPVSAFEAVRAAGVDAATLANYHVLDYGRVGLLDTLDAAAVAGVPTFGAGRDAAPARFTVRGAGAGVPVPGCRCRGAGAGVPVPGCRGAGAGVAVPGFSKITTLAETWGAGRPARGGADVRRRAGTRGRAAGARVGGRGGGVPERGPEGVSRPSQRQAEFTRVLVDAGADIIGILADQMTGLGAFCLFCRSLGTLSCRPAGAVVTRRL